MATAEVIRKFRTRVKRGEMDDLQVIYNVSGGMPAEGMIDEEVSISGNRHASVRSSGMRGEPRKASIRLNDKRFKALMKQVGESLDGMLPRQKAHFLPDSVIGTITLKVAGEETTLYFNADREAQQARARASTLERIDAITSLDQLKKELLAGKEK